MATGVAEVFPIDYNQDVSQQHRNGFSRNWLVESLLVSLENLEKEEFDLNDEFTNLRESHKALDREVARVDLSRGQIGSAASASRSLSNHVLSNASLTANKTSSAVRRLDVEKARVTSTVEVVELVSELKACVLGVTGSMGAPQDWETAATYLNRASKIPHAVTNGSFAEKIVPTAEVPDPPSVTLAQAAESLQSLFLREFDKAALEGNSAKVTRFFKLFPLIGKPDIGLDVYGRYVCQGVSSRARSNINAERSTPQSSDRLFFANALTKLFEHIAQIVESHGALVERHYGNGRMVKVIERLQLEADVHGGIILDMWNEELDIDRKLTDVKSYAFTFLVQSFLPAPSARNNTPRIDSPAKLDASDNVCKEDSLLDMKAIDSLLNEMTLMLSRWSLYTKFIATKCMDVTETSTMLCTPDVLAASSLRRKIASRIIDPFNVMTAFFLRRSVEKAFQLDEQPSNLSLDGKQPFESNPPYITSAVDDVMYIVSQMLDKSLQTSQKAVIASIVPAISRVLSSDFIGMIQRKMRDESYPKPNVQGALPPESITITFLILMNNLDVAKDYTRRIVEGRIEKTSAHAVGAMPNIESSSAPLVDLFPLDNDAAYVANLLRALDTSFAAKATELIGDGAIVAFKNIIKPRLRPLLTDTFRDVDYQMTHDELREATAMLGDSSPRNPNAEGFIQQSFQEGWDALTKPLNRILTENNAERILTLMLTYLNEVLEKRIWSYFGRLDHLGGVRLERDIASIVNVIVRGGKYRFRETFARCSQICVIMNMEDEEWESLKLLVAQDKSEALAWQLNTEERARARSMIRSQVN